MTLRDEFEKLCPVPDGVHRSKIIDDCYAFDFGADLSLVNHYNSKYQGFLLGRSNTVSVERTKSLIDFIEKCRQAMVFASITGMKNSMEIDLLSNEAFEIIDELASEGV